MSMYPKHLKYSNIIFRMTQHLFLKTLPLSFYPLLQRINMVGNLYLACIFIVLQFWPTLGGIPGTWAIFPSPRDSKLIREDFGFQWNGQKENFWTLTYGQSGRHISSLSDYDWKVAESGLRAALFWPTLGQFRGTWVIFPSTRDFKLILVRPWFLEKWADKNFWPLT